MSFDETFRFDAVTRARIAPDFDVEALERLFQHLDPLTRPHVLDGFLIREFQIYAQPNVWGVIKEFTDPVLNDLLADVWQPFWDTQPDEMLADLSSPYPGRELARRRRQGN